MILSYANGSRTEAFLLARTDNKLRVAIPGCADTMELTHVHGTWISEDCEPVHVQFAWEQKAHEPVPSEADCVCSEELAARLLRLLWAGTDEEELQSQAPLLSGGLAAMTSSSRAN